MYSQRVFLFFVIFDQIKQWISLSFLNYAISLFILPSPVLGMVVLSYLFVWSFVCLLLFFLSKYWLLPAPVLSKFFIYEAEEKGEVLPSIYWEQSPLSSQIHFCLFDLQSLGCSFVLAEDNENILSFYLFWT